MHVTSFADTILRTDPHGVGFSGEGEDIMAVILQRLMLWLGLVLLTSSVTLAAVERRKFTTATAYLVVEILDDDLVHFEAAALYLTHGLPDYL
jgi:hypothetical protein